MNKRQIYLAKYLAQLIDDEKYSITSVFKVNPDSFSKLIESYLIIDFNQALSQIKDQVEEKLDGKNK